MGYAGAFAVFFFLMLGFWMLVFLGSFIPVMILFVLLDIYKPELAEKLCTALGITIKPRS